MVSLLLSSTDKPRHEWLTEPSRSWQGLKICFMCCVWRSKMGKHQMIRDLQKKEYESIKIEIQMLAWCILMVFERKEGKGNKKEGWKKGMW